MTKMELVDFIAGRLARLCDVRLSLALECARNVVSGADAPSNPDDDDAPPTGLKRALRDGLAYRVLRTDLYGYEWAHAAVWLARRGYHDGTLNYAELPPGFSIGETIDGLIKAGVHKKVGATLNLITDQALEGLEAT